MRPRFEQRESAIELDEGLVDRPFHFLREVVRCALEEQCQRALGALPEGALGSGAALLERARAALAERIEERPTLAALAARLRMSTRSLQRALMREGTSFSELLDAERRRRSAELLEHGAVLKEAALRVGYADPSALTRARRRWRSRSQ